MLRSLLFAWSWPALLAASGIYGPGIQADSLANTPIGKGGVQLSCRFRADHSGTLRAIRPYLIWSFKKKGYHAGTGGTLCVTLQADDGSSGHLPTGVVLARNVQRMSILPTSSTFYPQMSFDPAIALQAGNLYHLVFSNQDPDPEGNFVSVNGLFNKEAGTPQQPALPESDWAMLFRTGAKAAWVPRRTPGSSESFTPILQIDYADGHSQGMGYVEFWMGAPKPIGGAAAVRETFTVTGPARKVNAVAVRVRRLAGNGPLVVTLEQGDGKVLEVGKGDARAIAATPSGALGGCGWATFTLAGAPTLSPGRTYHLVLSATGDGRYEAFPLRKGSDKGFSDATLFPDGHAECTDGKGWTGWEQWGKKNLTNADLQFYFKLGS